MIDSPEKVHNFVKHLIGFDEQEKFVTIFLNGNNEIIKHEIISTGTVNMAIVFPREVSKNAIKENAVSVIFAHNHPSGNKKPSNADVELTKKLKSSLKLFDIDVLDHLIITKNDFYSMKQNGDI